MQRTHLSLKRSNTGCAKYRSEMTHCRGARSIYMPDTQRAQMQLCLGQRVDTWYVHACVSVSSGYAASQAEFLGFQVVLTCVSVEWKNSCC